MFQLLNNYLLFYHIKLDYNIIYKKDLQKGIMKIIH